MTVTYTTRHMAGRREYVLSDQECRDIAKQCKHGGQYYAKLISAIQAKQVSPSETSQGIAFSQDPYKFYTAVMQPEKIPADPPRVIEEITNVERQDFIKPMITKKKK